MISVAVAFNDRIHLKKTAVVSQKNVAFKNKAVVSSQISVAPWVGSVYQKSARPSQKPGTTRFLH